MYASLFIRAKRPVAWVLSLCSTLVLASALNAQTKEFIRMDGRVIAIDTPSGQPPAVHLDSPAEGSAVAGTVTIAGWALDSPFRPETRISGVVIYIDNVFQAVAPYGYVRTDVCNVHRSRPGCPYVGFSWQWDSGSVALGSHQIKSWRTTAISPASQLPSSGT